MKNLVSTLFLTFSLLFLNSFLFATEVVQKEVPKEQKQKQNLESEKKIEKFSYYELPGQKGWWWYETPSKEAHQQIKEVQTKKDSATQTQKTQEQKQEQKQEQEKIKPIEEYTYEELLYMEPKEFRKIFDYYLEKAVTKPTEENLYYYFNLVDVARKKAALFSYMYDYMIQKYAQYLPTTAYPTSVAGVSVRTKLQAEEIKRYVLGKRSSYGLILFTRSDCPYCETQLRILNQAVLDGIDMKVVDVSIYPEAISKFGIETVPTIVLVHRNGQFMTIASGVQSLDMIYYAISKAIRILEGESPGRTGIYEFQKGTPLDPYEPPPLWRKKNKGER
ncbi:MAG: conjugal transfer protein TraF [Brevinematia bacterium]